MRHVLLGGLLGWLTILGVSGCVGPLVEQESARSVGPGQLEALAGYGQAGYVAKAMYGLTSRWDVGAQWEMLSWGLRTKYSLRNEREEGWSVAVAAGGGWGSDSASNYYGDAIVSWLHRQLEPYVALRYGHVHPEMHRIRNAYTGDVRYSIQSENFEYAQALLGARVWYGSHTFASSEVSLPVSMTNHVFMSQALLFGAALGYHF